MVSSHLLFAAIVHSQKKSYYLTYFDGKVGQGYGECSWLQHLVHENTT